jgi:hypothetical protein
MICYRFEDERYWMWYLTFGRLSYNPEAGPELWMRELKARFGAAAAADAEFCYLSASRILPLITTAHFPEHPSMHYWPELYTGAALFAKNSYEPYFIMPKSPQKKDNCYANALPSDETLFCSIEQFIDGALAGNPPEQYSPLAVADWYHALAVGTLGAVRRLTADATLIARPEAYASAVDFSMVAYIGLFHAWKSHAAYHLCLFEKTGDTAALAPAYRAMCCAREAYARVSALGDRHYARDLEFDAGTSTRRNGNWRDRLEQEVDVDLADLAALLQSHGVTLQDAKPSAIGPASTAGIPTADAADCPVPTIPVPKIPDALETAYAGLTRAGAFRMTFSDDTPRDWQPGKALRVRLTPGWLQGLSAAHSPVLHYRRATMRDGGFARIEMVRAGESFVAEIPGEAFTPDYDMYVYFTCRDTSGGTLIHPGVFHAEHALPIRVIRMVRMRR